jgi:hypothetical protein
VRSTITATGAGGKDLMNDEGEKTPPKGSYMVTNVKRGSPMSQAMQEHITHAKYWSTGRPVERLSEDEAAEGEEGHFGPNGKPTTPAKAHYGHITVNGKRYDYQKQHILHPRLVNVPERKKNKKTGEMEDSEHMIPTDSRFKDEEFLPKNRFMTKNGKPAGHILMTTPTESTSNVQHHTSFTHHVGPEDIEHAKKNRGEYVIDSPMAQEASEGKEYAPPQPITFSKKVKKAAGGSVEPDTEFDQDMLQNPEQSFWAQHHLSRRHDPEERHEWEVQNTKPASVKRPVTVHTDTNMMRHEMMTRRKAQ